MYIYVDHELLRLRNGHFQESLGYLYRPQICQLFHSDRWRTSSWPPSDKTCLPLLNQTDRPSYSSHARPNKMKNHQPSTKLTFRPIDQGYSQLTFPDSMCIMICLNRSKIHWLLVYKTSSRIQRQYFKWDLNLGELKSVTQIQICWLHAIILSAANTFQIQIFGFWNVELYENLPQYSNWVPGIPTLISSINIEQVIWRPFSRAVA